VTSSPARRYSTWILTKAEGKGTGLGLSTVYGIVKQSGGYIWVYSEPGRGATFEMYFPRVARAVEAEADTPHLAADLRGGETVLVVEDQPMLRRLVQRILEQHGYRAIPAANGREALKIAGAPDQAIDIIVTDVVMPEMSGLELGARARELRPGVRILYTSGYTQEAPGGGRPLPDGVKFLQKPFTPAALLEKVREARA